MDEPIQDSQIFNDTPEEKLKRRQLRQKYREKRSEILENRDVLISDGKELNKQLKAINELYSEVRNPREAVCDANLLNIIAEIGRQKAQDLPINLVRFEPIEYTEKLITYMLGDRLASTNTSENITSEGWQSLGQEAAKFMKMTPTFHYMFGSFDRGEIVPKERAPRVSRKDKDGPGVPAKPQELDKDGQDPVKETTTEEVERVLSILNHYYNREKSPICYFEFVINPHSFGLTIENIFHVSFLVRDGAARVYLDSDKLPVIEPINNTHHGDPRKNQNKQMIVTLSKDEWLQIIETFQIKNPIIKRKSTGSQLQR